MVATVSRLALRMSLEAIGRSGRGVLVDGFAVPTQEIEMMRMRYSFVFAVVTVLVAPLAASAASLPPRETCLAAQDAALAKYAQCRAKAEKEKILGGTHLAKYDPAVSKCGGTLESAWNKAVAAASAAGVQCWNVPRTLAEARRIIDDELDRLVAQTGTGIVEAGPSCPQTDGCYAALAVCQAAAPAQFPSTGQAASFGAASDGSIRAGQWQTFTDNGDGTITDNTTKLMWETKGQVYDIHNFGLTYTWASNSSNPQMDGTIKTEFLDVLNDVSGGGVDCFAGHCDWRIPNVKELATLLDLERITPPFTLPALSDAASCVPGGSVEIGCSITQFGVPYWSSTTDSGEYPLVSESRMLAYAVDFGPNPLNAGPVWRYGKANAFPARAVRSGY